MIANINNDSNMFYVHKTKKTFIMHHMKEMASTKEIISSLIEFLENNVWSLAKENIWWPPNVSLLKPLPFKSTHVSK
jgi:hypothetical protein